MTFSTVDQEFDTVSGFLLKRTKDMVNKYRQLLVRETQVRRSTLLTFTAHVLFSLHLQYHHPQIKWMHVKFQILLSLTRILIAVSGLKMYAFQVDICSKWDKCKFKWLGRAPTHWKPLLGSVWDRVFDGMSTGFHSRRVRLQKWWCWSVSSSRLSATLWRRTDGELAETQVSDCYFYHREALCARLQQKMLFSRTA